MKLWDKIRQIWEEKAEKSEKMRIYNFMLEEPFYEGGAFPKGLKRLEKRQAHKRNLTATYTYQEGDDLLTKKQGFIDQYTVNEKEQLWYFTQTPVDRINRARCKAWRDHEQIERLCAHRDWRKVVRRNHRAHMRAKFVNQKQGRE